jgi:hypothetical protein
MVSVDLLKQYTFFKGFKDEQIKKLADTATQESYKAGYLLWEKRDRAKKLLLAGRGKGCSVHGCLYGHF